MNPQWTTPNTRQSQLETPYAVPNSSSTMSSDHGFNASGSLVAGVEVAV